VKSSSVNSTGAGIVTLTYELLPLLSCYDIQILIAATMPDRRSDADEVIRQLHEHRKRRASDHGFGLSERGAGHRRPIGMSQPAVQR